MSRKFQAPRGTNDIIPAPRQNDPIFETHRWQFIETQFLLNAWAYGYEEIRTPIFEDIELFMRSSGEASDIVRKEMYEFTDKGDRLVALKPEGTAPVMRAYLEHGIGNAGSPTRLCYINHSFRYGRPGKGRYRQLHQLGMELVGSNSHFADAEIITATADFFVNVGLDSTQVVINSIGDFAARSQFGDAILKHVAAFLADQPSDERERLEKNPVRLLDSKDEKLKAALVGHPAISTFLSAESQKNFDDVQTALTEAEVDFTVDPTVVRGLDYYNDVVFEFIDPDLPGLSLCGGGRYDSLIEQIGGKATPAVGVGIGLERLLLTLETKGVEIERPGIDAFVVSATESARTPVRKLANDLRTAGFSVQSDIDSRNIKQQFKSADRMRAAFTIVIGDDELAKNAVTIKDMSDQSQVSIPAENVQEWLESAMVKLEFVEE